MQLFHFVLQTEAFPAMPSQNPLGDILNNMEDLKNLANPDVEDQLLKQGLGIGSRVELRWVTQSSDSESSDSESSPTWFAGTITRKADSKMSFDDEDPTCTQKDFWNFRFFHDFHCYSLHVSIF